MRNVAHRDRGLSDLVAVGGIHVDFESSNLAVGHPVQGRRLPGSVGPYRDRSFSARKGGAGPANGEAKYHVGTVHGPFVLIHHLDDKRRHDMLFEIIHLAVAG
jgi:hypothetical protein